MRFFYIVLTVSAAVLVLLLLICLLVRLRMCFARRKVMTMDVETKRRQLNEALAPFGFFYEERDDSISSGMYPWQRQVGYCRAYDEAAITMNMVFDCEPIYFQYNGKSYLIEMWKGQYGCTTSAEIGIYVNDEREYDKPPRELFYQCVSDEERLPMQFVLRRRDGIVMQRRAVHWWLTGFAVGLFSHSSELIMEVGIGFPNSMMRRAFCIGLLETGYCATTLRIEQNWVFLVLNRPHSPQPDRYPAWYGRLKNYRNRKLCALYLRMTKPFESTLDRISYLGYCFPFLYKALIRIGMGVNRRKLRKFVPL